MIVFLFIVQRYQEIADERYAAHLAEYEKRLKKAQEDSIVPVEEPKKPKKSKKVTKDKKSTTAKKKATKKKAIEKKSLHHLRARKRQLGRQVGRRNQLHPQKRPSQQNWMRMLINGSVQMMKIDDGTHNIIMVHFCCRYFVQLDFTSYKKK